MPEEDVTPKTGEDDGWLKDTWDSVTGHVSAYGAGIWTFVWSTLTDFIPEIGSKAFNSWKKAGIESQTMYGDVMKAYRENAAKPGTTLQAQIDEARLMPWPWGWLMSGYLETWGPFTIAKERMRLSLLPTAYKAAEKTQSEIPPLETVLREWFRSPDDRTQLKEYLHDHNFGGIALDTLVKATRNFGDVQTILTMRNRDLIETDTKAQEYIQKLGFADVDAQRILELRNMIPPVQDIIRMAVREAFSPVAIKAFQLDEAYPDLLTAWAEKQGLSEGWAKAYWRAHWVLPSVGQGYEMMWRTDFSEDDLDLLMKTADISPYFRPYLKQIAYHPYTRVDVRRMYDLGVLKESELLQAYKDLGFDAEKAANMVTFTIRYTNRTETRTMVSSMMWAAENGLMTWEDAEKNVALLLDDADEAHLMIAQARAEQAIEISKKKIARIKRLYTQKRIDRGAASDRLDELNIQADAKADMIEDWDEERKAKDRYPSKADLIKYLGAEVIEPWEFVEEMERLGFDMKYIEWEAKSIGIDLTEHPRGGIE